MINLVLKINPLLFRMGDLIYFLLGSLSLNKVKLFNSIIDKLYSNILETMNFVEVYFRIMGEVRFYL